MKFTKVRKGTDVTLSFAMMDRRYSVSVAYQYFGCQAVRQGKEIVDFSEEISHLPWVSESLVKNDINLVSCTVHSRYYDVGDFEIFLITTLFQYPWYHL